MGAFIFLVDCYNVEIKICKQIFILGFHGIHIVNNFFRKQFSEAAFG